MVKRIQNTGGALRGRAEQGGYPNLLGDFKRLHDSQRPLPLSPFFSHIPLRGTHGLHGFASKSRDSRISRKGLEPEWPQYQPRHLTGTMSNKQLCRKRSYFLPSSSPLEIKVGGISVSRFLVISEKELKQLLGLPRQILSPGIACTFCPGSCHSSDRGQNQ